MRVIGAILFAIMSLFGSSAGAVGTVSWSGSVELPGGILLEFTVLLTDDSGTISIPMQGAMDVPLSDVSTADGHLRFTIRMEGAPESTHARFDLEVADDGRTAAGLLRQGGGEFKVSARRLDEGETPAPMRRPQEPRPPFPYESHDVTFRNDTAGVTLAGTLSIPGTPGPHPAVVLISGSGPQDRDESILGHRPFLVLSDYLVRRGIAVLRHDDRGVGGSTGSFAASTSDDFATDAMAAIAYLKQRPEIDAGRIGLAGHSEGGIVAPMCAAQSDDVAFIVLLAGTGVPGSEILEVQGRLIAVAMGKSEEEARRGAQGSVEIYRSITDGGTREEILEQIKSLAVRQIQESPEGPTLSPEEVDHRAEVVANSSIDQVMSPWFIRFLRLDPREYLVRVKCPVLAINGTVDLQVHHEQNLPEIEKALRAGGNQDVTIVALPGLNHLFQHSETGSPSEYSRIEETFAPEALELIASWIRQRTGLKD